MITPAGQVCLCDLELLSFPFWALVSSSESHVIGHHCFQKPSALLLELQSK